MLGDLVVIRVLVVFGALRVLMPVLVLPLVLGVPGVFRMKASWACWVC